MKLLVFFQSFAAVFAITDPLGAAPIFLGLTMEMTRKQQWRSAIRASLWSFGILAISGLCGNIMLKVFAISLPAFQAAGGLVIVLMGLEMLGGSPTKVQHEIPSMDKDDPIIVPFAMPLVAGPGAITTVITLTAQHRGWVGQALTLSSVAAATIVLFITLVSASWLARKMSPQGIKIFLRFAGLILLAIGAELLLSGIQEFMFAPKG